MAAEIHTTAPTVSENAQESTFAEVDDRERTIPAIEFRNVVLAFDDRVARARADAAPLGGGFLDLGRQDHVEPTIFLEQMRDGTSTLGVGSEVAQAAPLASAPETLGIVVRRDALERTRA